MINQRRLREAMAAHQAGRLDEAETRYARLAKESPLDPALMHLRGVVAGQAGDLARSVELLEAAIRLRPDEFEFHRNLAITHRRAGNPANAIETWLRLGNRLADSGRLPDAGLAFEEALKIDDHSARAANNLGVVLNLAGQHDQANAALGRALAAIEDGSSDAPAGLQAQLHHNKANSLVGLGLFEEAFAHYDRSLLLAPDDVEARNDHALALLAAGDLRRGFAEWEWRTRLPDHKPRGFPQPQWRGESPEELNGALLVRGEQGFGDAIQFARYVPMLAERGHRILFEVKPELAGLMAQSMDLAGITVVPTITEGSNGVAAEEGLDFAAHVGLLSLPHILETDLQSIPAVVPYLQANPSDRDRWQARLAQAGKRLKVGLCWGGNPRHPRNAERSIPAPHLHALLAREDTTFFILQKGPATRWPFPAGNVTPLDLELESFADTAAAIDGLDLVISVDTAVAHLAGALGRPTWVLLPFVADWRWLRGREDSPWYPTARLFRQETAGDWPGLLSHVAVALDEFARQRGEG